MIVTQKQKNLLSKYIDDLDKLIAFDDINDFLLKLDDLITEIGFDENYELNEEGLKLQKAYDEIYEQN